MNNVVAPQACQGLSTLKNQQHISRKTWLGKSDFNAVGYINKTKPSTSFQVRLTRIRHGRSVRSLLYDTDHESDSLGCSI